MAKIGMIQEVAIDDLTPYANNAKKHSDAQVEQIAKSIQEFGFISPVLIDEDNNIIAGHGRIAAARKNGLKSVPCVYVEGLTEAQFRAYVLADNKLTEAGEWDSDLVAFELSELEEMNFDISLTGFEFINEEAAKFDDWTKNRDAYNEKAEEDEAHKEWLEKFEEKHTTDDCYTPENVFDVIVDYVERTFGLNRDNFVRPFYPGGDYQKYRYGSESVVVDNPPFSILSAIVDWYQEHGIKFFLFGPHLTLLSNRPGVTTISVGATIVYENGAKVCTSFLTNMMPGIAAKSEPKLRTDLDEANKQNDMHAELPKYEYPDNISTATQLGFFSKYGIEFIIPEARSEYVRELDAMKESEKKIYGGGLLMSNELGNEYKQAKQKAQEQKAQEKTTKWQLSERELLIVERLGANNE